MSMSARLTPGRWSAIISRDGDFTAELELDEDGLVEFYPRLACRVSPGERSDPND